MCQTRVPKCCPDSPYIGQNLIHFILFSKGPMLKFQSGLPFCTHAVYVVPSGAVLVENARFKKEYDATVMVYEEFTY